MIRLIQGQKGARRKIKRAVLEAMPESVSKVGLSRAIGVGEPTIIAWQAKGLPYTVAKMPRSGIAHIFRRDEVIQWLIKANWVYAEEWIDE